MGETVQVTADAGTAGLNKTNPTIATSINARAIEELPLPGGRNINNLVLTVPNASSTTGQGTYAINGNRPRNNNYMVDGSDNNDISVTIATSQIVPESVAEFQVMQNPYSVEFGRNSGGQINVITKSGSNRFSGRLLRLLPVERLELADQHREGEQPGDAAQAHSPSARRRSRRPGAARQAVLLRSLSAGLAAPGQPAQSDDDPDPDAGRLRGAPERAAARRPVGGEPPGGSAADCATSRTSTARVPCSAT